MPRLLLFFVLAAIPSGIAGQEALTIGIMPRVGLFSPDSYFYEEFSEFGSDQPTEWTNGTLGRSAYVALGLEAGWKDRGLLLRGELGRSFEGWLFVTHGIVQPRVFWNPPEIFYTNLDVPATLTFANLQVILPARFSAWGIEPYFLLGGGGKWYRFGKPTRDYTVEPILPSDGFTASLELGAGLTLKVRGMELDTQIRDGLSEYWGKYQNDLVFSGGLIWRIR
jgi:hypothetical protein